LAQATWVFQPFGIRCTEAYGTAVTMSRFVLLTLLGLTQGVIIGPKRQGLLQAIRYKQELRVCNAFPGLEALEIVKEGFVLTGKDPLKYKTCRTVDTSVSSGDKLEFFVANQGTSEGTFTIWELPQHDATMLLVVHRRKETTHGVSFLSHVFAPSKAAQVAIIDTYGGAVVDPAKLRINDGSDDELLSFDTVVGVNPGDYKISMEIGEDKAKTHGKLIHKAAHFHADKGESYVLLRTGWSGLQKQHDWPMEFVVYPGGVVEEAPKQPTLEHDHSSAPTAMLAPCLLVAIFACLLQ